MFAKSSHICDAAVSDLDVSASKLLPVVPMTADMAAAHLSMTRRCCSKQARPCSPSTHRPSWLVNGRLLCLEGPANDGVTAVIALVLIPILFAGIDLGAWECLYLWSQNPLEPGSLDPHYYNIYLL